MLFGASMLFQRSWRFAVATIPVELPEDLCRFVEAKVSRGPFANAGEYIVALVDAARREVAHLEAALIEGLESGPAEPWTADEWAAIRRRVVERHAKE